MLMMTRMIITVVPAIMEMVTTCYNNRFVGDVADCGYGDGDRLCRCCSAAVLQLLLWCCSAAAVAVVAVAVALGFVVVILLLLLPGGRTCFSWG